MFRSFAAPSILFALVLALLTFPACAQGEGETAENQKPEKREVDKAVISDPGHEKMNAQAPDQFKAKFHTTAGDFVIEVHRNWAPLGADRFYNLVRNGFYDGNRFFRVVPGFVVQWGMHGDPEVTAAWRESEKGQLKDDEVKESNTRGKVVFATGGPNSRTTQLFINYDDNSRLDRMGFAPFGEVVKGMDVVDDIESKHGQRPDQRSIHMAGNRYLDANFPDLDHIITATIVEDDDEQAEEDGGE